MKQLVMEDEPSEIERLEKSLGIEFKHLTAARKVASIFRQQLVAKLGGLHSDDSSIVIFGSLARDEFTAGSDVDWTLLVDGVADPQHLAIAQRVRTVVDDLEVRKPGREGIFGNMAFSHPIIHQIGGEDDTNRNTTQRILLVLESRPVSRRGAYDRVLNHILTRYIEEDPRFLEKSAALHVPRFLLNDFARYWRTMAVDFAYKRRTRQGDGAVIRNLKLRMSRKLIFVSGLLVCFSFHLLLNEMQQMGILTSPKPTTEYVRHLRRLFARTPLEILAAVINRFPHLSDHGAKMFESYNYFIGTLADESKREHLSRLSIGHESFDPSYLELQAMSHKFRDGLLELFFDEESGLSKLTKTYGIF